MKIFNPSKINCIPKGILFDTDNTLYDYEPAHAAAQRAVEKKVIDTFSIKGADFNTAFLQARADIKHRLGATAASHSRLLYMQRMLEIMGLGSQVLIALDLEQTYWRTFLSAAVLFDGVTELLDDIRLLGIPSAVVTDLTAQIQFRKIVYFGLDNYFDHIVTSEEVGKDKPDAGMFQLAISKMQLRDEGPIWMIGDNPVNDIKGSKEAIGALTFQKIHKGISIGTGGAQPDVAFEQFADLRDYLAGLKDLK